MDRSRRVVSRRGATRSFSGFRARGVDVSHHTLTVYTYEEPNATPTFLSVHRTARDVTRTAASSQRPTKRFAFAHSHSCPQSLSSARRRAIRPSAWTLRLTLDERRTVSSVHHLIPPVGADRRVPIDTGLENKTRPRLTTTPTRSRTLSPVRAARSTRSRRTNENNRPHQRPQSFKVPITYCTMRTAVSARFATSGCSTSYCTRRNGSKQIRGLSRSSATTMPTDEASASTSRRGTHARTPNTSTNMSVQEYIEKHDLTKKIEEALNAAVKAKAEEPLAFVVRTFFSRSPTRLGRGTALDDRWTRRRDCDESARASAVETLRRDFV